MNKSRNLLLPKDYLLVGNTVNNPQHNFTLAGSIELPPKTYTFTSNTIVRDISFVGTRAAAHDNLSDTSLLGEYEEIIHGMLPYPIKIQGTFIATRRSKQTEDFLIKATDPDEYSTETQTSTNNSTIYRYHKKIQQRLLITKAQVKLGIKHDFPEQLSINLINPQGETLKLRSQGKQTPRTDALDYEAKHQAIDPLEQLANHYTNGTWTIEVTDHLNDSFEPELTQYKLILTGNNVYSLSITFPSNLDGKLVMINGCGSSYFASISNGNITFKDLSECRYQIVILDPLYPDAYPVSIAGKDKVLDLSTGTKAVTPQYKDTLDFTVSPRIGNVPQTIYITVLTQLPAGYYFDFWLLRKGSRYFSGAQYSTSTNNQVAFDIQTPGVYTLDVGRKNDEGGRYGRWKRNQFLIFGQPKSTAHTLTYRIGGSAGIALNQQPLIKQYAYDSATFDIDRFPFISSTNTQAGAEDSDGFNGEIDSISGTNKSNTQLVEEGGVYIYKYIPDGRIQQPVGDNNHYRINISIGQFISGNSVDNNYRLSNTPFPTTSTTSQ
jgi:subtilisin-like proprotein convertase family protein